jgi:outer membrane protein OmpA-like peptidoglycan-associated protein
MAVISLNVNGQVNLKDRLKKAVNNASQTVANSKKNKENNQQPVEQNQVQPEQNKPAEVQAEPKKEEPSLQAFSKYDFVPGEKVIFYEDFSQDAIGDFPALWNTNGSAEVVTTNLFPGNWLKFVTREVIWTDQFLNLPENYTIEFDVTPIKGEGDRMQGYMFRLIQSENAKAFDGGGLPGKAGFSVSVSYTGQQYYRTYINSEEGNGLGLDGSNNIDDIYQKENKKYHIAIWGQKARIRMYQDQNKLFDLPKAFNVSGVKFNRLRFEQGAAMIGNVRVAVGAPDTRNKLITEGRLVTYGIYFDVNKDVVKPESYGTLKEIAAALTENPGVRVKIIGHTDSDGADAANLDLSKRRAESVKSELAKTFSIDASRIETDGAGETKPVAPNDTPVNKALNRRVEFVKL